MSCTGRKYADTTLIHLKYIGITQWLNVKGSSFQKRIFTKKKTEMLFSLKNRDIYK